MADRPTDRPTNQPTDLPTNQLISQPTDQTTAMKGTLSLNLPFSMTVEGHNPHITRKTYKASIRQGASFCIQLCQKSSDYSF
jgi:hypothetical protein